MKVYVDELPKKCADCVFSETGFVWDSEVRFCKLKPRCMNWIALYVDKRKDCTLCSLSDYTKQVRKEVCEEISWKLNRRLNGVVNGKYSDEFFNGYSYCSSDIENILDQIQGETK